MRKDEMKSNFIRQMLEQEIRDSINITMQEIEDNVHPDLIGFMMDPANAEPPPNLLFHAVLCNTCKVQGVILDQMNFMQRAEKAFKAEEIKFLGEVPENPEWQLRTPSGLTLKFTDPAELLGWTVKLKRYKALFVSCDGKMWGDFGEFIRLYQEYSDPGRAICSLRVFPTSEILE